MGRAGSGTQSSENRTKVLRIECIHSRGHGTSSGHGEAWIRVPVQCCTECNRLLGLPTLEISSLI